MIIPAGVYLEKDSEEKLIIAFRKSGYSKETAVYLVGKIRGTIVDDNVIQ